MPSIARLIALLSAALLLTGCGVFVQPHPDPKLAAELSRFTYPKDAPLGSDLDIQLVRTGREHFQLINRMARSYPPSKVWINREYVGELDTIKIGPDNYYDLKRFINKHGELYQVGALLQPEKSYPIVLAEYIDPATGKRCRMVVRSGD
jgi:hypothetical protein